MSGEMDSSRCSKTKYRLQMGVYSDRIQWFGKRWFSKLIKQMKEKVIFATAGMVNVNCTPHSDIKYPLLHKQSLGFTHTALIGPAVKFLPASRGQRSFRLFCPFLVFAVSRISVLQNLLLLKRRQKKCFLSFHPGLSFSEQGRKAGD